MLTLLAFLLAIAVLVVVHEWGHYAMAVRCGVRVLRFSVGFGPALWTWKSPRSGTEFVVAAIPLGGYVRMLDGREGPVAAHEQSRAFDTQTLRRRAAIVAAGPAANLLLAVLLYTLVHWIGIEQAAPVLSAPATGSALARAGLVGGEHVVRVGWPEDEPEDIASFDDLQRWAVQAAVARRSLVVEYGENPERGLRSLRLDWPQVDEGDEGNEAKAGLAALGVAGPQLWPRIAELLPVGAARSAGLRSGDLVLRVDGQAVPDAAQLRERIRASGREGAPRTQSWTVLRDGAELRLAVTPQRVLDEGVWVGRIGAGIGMGPRLVLVQRGPVDGVVRAVERTAEVASLTVRMLVQMVTAQASIKNLGGPLTIADYAGRSAAGGLAHYLAYLALISISIGVLNLLPVPMLDGGHLMYYLWESLRGRPLSEIWMERWQRLGMAALLLLMSVALYNDVARLLG